MLLSVHIVAGLVAIVAGYVALFVLKGGRVHRRSGTVVVWSMIVMGMTASALSIVRSKPSTLLAGPLVAYMVMSAMLTVRRPAVASEWADRVVLLVGRAWESHRSRGDRS